MTVRCRQNVGTLLSESMDATLIDVEMLPIAKHENRWTVPVPNSLTKSGKS